MSTSDWTMKPRLLDSRSLKWTKLNEDIRCWERGFELEFRKPPKREDVAIRPFIGMLTSLPILSLFSLFFWFLAWPMS